MVLKTPLYNDHVALSAKMVDFHGWMMPLHYGSQIEEHHHVRNTCGMFDVSHMTIVDVTGVRAKDYLRYMLANDVAKLTPGRALYTAMLNEQGGIIDDLIVYHYTDEHFRLVVNSSTKEKDVAWLMSHSDTFDVTLTVQEALANIAIQGPQSREKLATLLPSIAATLTTLKPFHFIEYQDWQIATTGYTGEDGFEVILPANQVSAFWQDLLKVDVKPCGLGARDTLRLEAGLNLYGSDMDETITPLEANIAWTVAWEPLDRNFIGRGALEAQKAQNNYHRLVGILLEERGVLRAEQSVMQEDNVIGMTVSGTFSPTLQQGIAFARVKPSDDKSCEVEIRGKKLSARIVKLPFVRQGKILV